MKPTSPAPGPPQQPSEEGRRRIIQRIRESHPKAVSHLGAHELDSLVAQGWSNALELEISNERDVYRFISLQFLPKALLNDPFIQSVLIRLLNNVDLPSDARLDFIEKQVAGRRPPSASGE